MFIARGELCFAVVGGVRNTTVHGKNIASVQVFTSMNGYATPDECLRKNGTGASTFVKEEVMNALTKKVWMVGVAQASF